MMNQESPISILPEKIPENNAGLAENSANFENNKIMARENAEFSEIPTEASLLTESSGEASEIELEEPEIFPEISIRELAENRWSVISADDCAAISLRYEEAEKLVKQLHKSGIFGLCVVTDETAGRMLRNLIQNF